MVDEFSEIIITYVDTFFSSRGQDTKFLPDFTIVNKPNSESRPESNRSSITSSLSQMLRKKSSANTLDVNRRSKRLSLDKGLPTTKSFATDLFNFFNPSEKISSNEDSQNLRPSISTPDIRESSENPFSFKKVESVPVPKPKTNLDTFSLKKVESAPAPKTNLVTPVLMIFIIGGVTPSEIR